MNDKMLTDSMIKRKRSRPKVYTLRDGNGLFLIVHPNAAKYFQFRYSFGKRQRLMQLGRWPVLSLKEARKKAAEYQDDLAAGKDPVTMKRLRKLQNIREVEGSFAAVAAQWVENKRPDWTALNV